MPRTAVAWPQKLRSSCRLEHKVSNEVTRVAVTYVAPWPGICPLTFTSHTARQRCTEVSRRCHVTLNYASRSPQLLGYSTRATCEIFERFLELCSTLTSSVARTLLVGSISCSYRDTGVRCSVVGLFCSRPGGLELVTRLHARSVTFLWQFSPGLENFSFLVLLAYAAP